MRWVRRWSHSSAWGPVGFLGVLVLGLAACTESPASEAKPSGEPVTVTGATTPNSAPAPVRTATPEGGPTTSAYARTARQSPTLQSPTPESTPITIAVAGDVHFENQLRERLDEPAAALDPIAAQLSAADLTIVNLETSIGSSGTPEPKRFTFQAPPDALSALASAGVDVVTMANNHGLDYGTEGLADSLAAAEKAAAADPPVSVVGIGVDAEEAFAPALHEVAGTTVAVLGASTADDPTADPTGQWAADDSTGGIALALPPERLVEAVSDARATADIVVVYLHWGVQGERCPNSTQQELAEMLGAAGADIVVGSHAHVLQGAGMLEDTYVAYGLGNFVWYTQHSSITGLLTLTVEAVEGGRVVEEAWKPARVQADGLPRFITGTEAEQMTADFHALRDCAGLHSQ